MTVIGTIFKIAAIPCMLALIFLLLMIMGFIPDKRIIKFLKEHKKVQAAFAIMIAFGFIGAIIAIF